MTTNPTPTFTSPAEEIAWYRAENLRLQTLAEAKKAPVTFKVSPVGALSVYGLQRFPITLYLGQWLRFLETIDSLKKFIEENKSKMATDKADTRFAEARAKREVENAKRDTEAAQKLIAAH